MDIEKLAKLSGLSTDVLTAYTRDDDFLVLGLDRPDNYEDSDDRLETLTIYHLRRERLAEQLLSDDRPDGQILQAYQLAPKGSRVKLKALKIWLKRRQELLSKNDASSNDILNILSSDHFIITGSNHRLELVPKHRKLVRKLQNKLLEHWQTLKQKELEKLCSFKAIYPELCHCLAASSNRDAIKGQLKKTKRKFILKSIDLAETLEETEKLVSLLADNGCGKLLPFAIDKRDLFYRQAVAATDDLTKLRQLYKRQIECGAATSLETIAKIIQLAQA